MSVDIRITACHQRQPLIDAMLAQLGLDGSIVVYDDRPNGGDALYTARKCWMLPVRPGVTHRLLLQDDIELCDGFRWIVQQAATAFPEAVFGFYNQRLRFDDRKTTSPYILCPGGNLYGPAIMLPVSQIKPCFRWVDRSLGRDYTHADTGIGEYAYRHKIPVMSTIPSTLQHLAPNASLLGYNNKHKVSKVWRGRDLSSEDWSDANYSTTRSATNNLCLPKWHPYTRRVA